MIDLLNAGARGYITKGEAGDELLRAIRTVCEGRSYLSGGRRHGRRRPARQPWRLCRRATAHRARTSGAAAHRRGTEPRCRSASASIAASTVEVHRRNLMRKLDLHNVAELTRYASTAASVRATIPQRVLKPSRRPDYRETGSSNTANAVYAWKGSQPALAELRNEHPSDASSSSPTRAKWLSNSGPMPTVRSTPRKLLRAQLQRHTHAVLASAARSRKPVPIERKASRSNQTGLVLEQLGGYLQQVNEVVPGAQARCSTRQPPFRGLGLRCSR